MGGMHFLPVWVGFGWGRVSARRDFCSCSQRANPASLSFWGSDAKIKGIEGAARVISRLALLLKHIEPGPEVSEVSPSRPNPPAENINTQAAR